MTNRSGATMTILGATLVLLLGGLLILFLRDPSFHPAESGTVIAAHAPSELAPFREPFLRGIDAIQHFDPAVAIGAFESFSFGDRAVEEYRLYYLANAYQLHGDRDRARLTLATLWSRKPRLGYRTDAAFNLAQLYEDSGNWSNAARVLGTEGDRATQPDVIATARAAQIRAATYGGDPGAVLYAVRNLIVESPKSAEARAAFATYRAMLSIPDDTPVPLTLRERVVRCEHLLRDGDPAAALAELDAIAPLAAETSTRYRVTLDRGIALQRLARFEESDRVLQPLFATYYRYAVPALQNSARNLRALADSIHAETSRTIKVRQRAGTKTVRRKGKMVRIATYRTVTRTVTVKDPKLEAKRETYERMYAERLKDLLQTHASPEVRLDTLRRLLIVATEKKQESYMMELVAQIVALDRLADPGLQHFWDEAWDAYEKRDFERSRDLLDFIRTTYKSENIRRQASYWYARSLEHLGRKEEASAIFTKIADAPYEDLYARFAEQRGAKRRAPSDNPLDRGGASWPSMVSPHIPPELRLAFDLDMLGDGRDSRLEIQKNVSPSNRRWGEMILADLYYT
ncbi:MAG: hypothetical protein WBX15_10625, partial [Thermoanaerobaculia bacterium]